MTPIEQESILNLSLMAAFADGAKNDAERTEVKRIAESLPHDAVQTAALYQRVLLRQVTVAQAATLLQSPELRHHLHPQSHAPGLHRQGARLRLAGRAANRPPSGPGRVAACEVTTHETTP
jgi:hypothetical protein